MQDVTPTAAHTPKPQDVSDDAKLSSAVPLQSSSTSLQSSSAPVGKPGLQVSPGMPLVHDVTPLAAHTPKPQDVGVETKFSSAVPLQFWSCPSQSLSVPVGEPGLQVSPGLPLMHVCKPVDAHTPTPQVVGVDG